MDKIKLSELLSRRLYLGKGQLVSIIGRLQTRQWEDADKQRHWKTEIVANSVEMLSGKRNEGCVEGGGQGPSRDTAGEKKAS